jgi:hypothetical protein
MSVYFHANFNLNRDRLSGILKSLIEQPGLSDEQIAKQFGYKAPFTKRYKSWLKKCGILENSTKVKLTKDGKIIYDKDPQLNKEKTLLYMHSFLTSTAENAEVWNFFHHIFLPKNKSFTKSELSEAISMKLMPHNPSHFAKNAPMIKVITKVLLDSYISENAFGLLKKIELRSKIYYRT